MRRRTASGWGRAGHRRAVLVALVALAIVLGGGVAAWAEVSGGNAQYRMADVTRATIGTSLTVVGDVAPVSEGSSAFQVGGKVATVIVAPGEQVAAGQTLGTLDTTALAESVSSAESTLSADQAKLVEDEQSQASAASSDNSGANANKAQGSSPSSTTTTTSTHGGSGGSGSGSGSPGSTPTVTADQSTLTQDQSTLSTDQQKEAADLSQAQSECTAAKTDTPTGQATCETALETVSSDEAQVTKDQAQVAKDETALAQALAAASSGGTGSGGGSSPTQTGHAVSSAQNGLAGNTGTGTGNTGAGTGTGSSSSGAGSNGGTGGTGGTGGSGASTDTPAQIASDQANIDSAQADLTEAQQALDDATLSSPISGTIVSVGINVGDTVSAGSSTETITIIGTKSYEVQATLDSSQVPSVKVGQSATVSVDGLGGTMEGTVSQVGPVQSSSSGYSYPVVIALPSSSSGLFPGSTANVVISTGEVSDVVAVPTSAVETLGPRAYVLELSKGTLTRKIITIGMVGDTYTQVRSGLEPGQSVVLADYSEAVPSSNTNTNLGSFLGGGGGGGGFFFPGGAGGGSPGGAGGQFQFRVGTSRGG